MQSTVPLGVDLMKNNNPNNISNLFTGGGTTIEPNNFQSTSTFFVKDQTPILPDFMNFRRIANETPNNFSLNLPITAINTPTPSHKRKSSTPSNQSTDTTPDTVRSQPTRKRKSKLLAGDAPITIPITIPNHNNNNNTNNNNTNFNGTPAISVSPLSNTSTTTSTTATTSPTQNQGGINSSQELLAEKDEGVNASGNTNGTGMVTIGGKLYHESQLDSIDESTLTVDERKQLKKQRRLVKNREAAQLFRQRQKEYIVNLERRATELTQANHEASARVELLSSENKLMKEQLVYLRNFMKQAVSFSFPFDPKVMGFTPFQTQPPSLVTPTTPNHTTISTPPISISSPIISSSPTTLDTPPITQPNNNYSPMPIMSVSGSITTPIGMGESSSSSSSSTTTSNNNQLQATTDIPKDLQNPLYPD